MFYKVSKLCKKITKLLNFRSFKFLIAIKGNVTKGDKGKIDGSCDKTLQS